MITFMNFDNSTLPNLGSGRISRLGTSRRRGIFHLFTSVDAFSGTEKTISAFTYLTHANYFALRATLLIYRATRKTAPFMD
jgi:hypothetical protein